MNSDGKTGDVGTSYFELKLPSTSKPNKDGVGTAMKYLDKSVFPLTAPFFCSWNSMKAHIPAFHVGASSVGPTVGPIKKGPVVVFLFGLTHWAAG